MFFLVEGEGDGVERELQEEEKELLDMQGKSAVYLMNHQNKISFYKIGKKN